MVQKQTLLIKNAEYIVTVNKSKQILKKESLYINGNTIEELPSKRTRADRVINASDKIVLPGFINSHHHMFQCGLRGNPQVQNQKIDRWIATVCDFTKQQPPEYIYNACLANMAELLLYGCTTTADMLYIFPKKSWNFFETTIQAARDIGIRFHPYRGSMSLSSKNRALFPDDVVETSKRIIEQSEDAIRKFHDPSENSMVAVGLAPCAIFTSSKEDFRNAALLSKKYNINIQTHLSESAYEDEYAIEKFGKRPLSYLQNLGWGGKRTSFTHCITLDRAEIRELAMTHTNVVHCPISNARASLGERGIAPIWEMLEKGVNVAVGVDGSAGNDSSNMLEELRWARTLQGVAKKSTYLKPMQTLQMGTKAGAKLLGREERIGSLEVGKAADIGIFDLNRIEYSGSGADPVASLLSCQAQRADTVVVNGRIVVHDGCLQSIDEERIVRSLRYAR